MVVSRSIPAMLMLLATTLPAAAAGEPALPAPSQPVADNVDQNRFGGPPADAAYGAFQRGL